MLDKLRGIYCGRIGYEFMHINDAEQKIWLQRRIEGDAVNFTPEGKKAILNKLIEAEGFEKFASNRFVGTKRFGLDGAEATIPALEQIIKRGGQLGVSEIVLGMAHRGRLNVLVNVMGKPYRQLFHEFQGGSANPDDVEGSGDVKYHLGASSDREFDGQKVHLSLTPNPSHLEIVNPVVLGKARAKQWQLHDIDARTSVLPVLIHGDAAFAGQGVVAECFAMSGIKGFRTGGTMHFVINNQIGFTTAPIFSRSSPYCTDIALMVQAPIFHVNGDDPEAVVHATRIAIEFRQKFKKDVVLDMICYRRFGHNESDEPSFTQPQMYRVIKDHPSTLQLYTAKLVKEGTLSQADADAMAGRLQQAAGRGIRRLQVASAQPRRLAGRPLAGPGNRAQEQRPARRDQRHRRRAAQGRQGAGHGARQASTCTRPSPASWKPRPRCSRPAKASTGPPAKRWPSAPCWTKASMSACRARIPSAAPSASAMPPWSTSRPRNAISRCSISARTRAASR